MLNQEITQSLREQISRLKSPEIALRTVCETINAKLADYDWVGFYFMNHDTQKLHLGPYVGDPTDHTIIDFGKGICGQVAVSGETYLSADVNAEANYIACSINVRSEIVVPMYKEGRLIGQIDIDSHKVDRFKAEDEAFLKEINEIIVAHVVDLESYINELCSVKS